MTGPSTPVLAGLGAVAVVLAFLGGAALLGGEDAPPAAGPSLRPTASASPSGPASPSPAPSPSAASPSASASPAAAPSYDADALLLTTAEARAADPGGPAYREGEPVQDGPLLDPCPGGTAYPRDADRVDRASRELVSDEEGGATAVRQQVARYRSAQAAADAFDGYLRAVGACPTRTEGTVTTRHEVLDRTARGGAQSVLVRVSSDDAANPGEALLCCFQYVAVQRSGDAVSLLLAGSGGDGDPTVDVLVPFADTAGARLARTAG